MIKLHLGCGWRDFGPDWIHIDNGDYKHLNIKSNINKLEFPNDFADLIYASHAIAYFDRQEALEVLREWHRVLKPGGILRIATPDFASLITLYQKKEIVLEQMLGPLYGKMPMDTQTIYHKTAYDLSSMEAILKQVGFLDIKLYDWKQTEHAQFDDHSQAYIPHMDKNNGTLISLNIEATK